MKKYIISGFVFVSMFLFSACEKQMTLSPPEAQQKLENFINANLLQGSKLIVKEFTEEYGLYKMVADPGNGQEITSYLTRDAKLFFPQMVDMEDFAKQKKAVAEAQAAQRSTALSDIEKNEIPVVELFVMSHCPFGTQIEKGFLPVLKALGDKIDFQLKFVNYVMHDKKEIDEQLVQYCIQKENPEKLLSYLGCFLEEGKTDTCLDEQGIDKTSLQSCVAQTDEAYSITKDYEEKNNWRGNFPSFAIHNDENKKYGVQGSPTLIVNGKKIQTSRDPKSLMQTVCAGFETQPEECSIELPSDTPSAGFGFGTSSSDTAAAQCR
jgi:glutaredoxin